MEIAQISDYLIDLYYISL